MLMPSLDTSIANASLPALAQGFGASFQAAQSIVLAYLLAITTLIIGAGRLGDMLGRRRMLLAGIALFTAASALCGVAPTLAWLLGARALQGLGAALMMALSIASVGDAVAREKAGSAMGLLGAMSAIGTTLGPALGGMLSAGFGWRAIFLVNIPLGVANFALAWRALPVDRPAGAGARGRFDVAGMLVLALTLGAYALALTLKRGHFGALKLALLLGAGAGVMAFLKIEASAASPLISLALLRQRALRFSLAMSMLVTTVLMSTLVIGPFYLARALGLGATQVGLALAAGPLLAALGGVPAGRCVDRFGAPRMTLTGLAGIVLACALLAALPMRVGLAGYLLPIACMTSSYALFQAANNTRMMARVAPGQRGVVSGLISLARNLGLITGASLMGALFAGTAVQGDMAAAPPATVAAGMHHAFMAGAALAAIALSLAIAGARRRE
ncbi:MAG: MFS transporter [Pseudomonadota bacterium]